MWYVYQRKACMVGMVCLVGLVGFGLYGPYGSYGVNGSKLCMVGFLVVNARLVVRNAAKT